jgi:hypothetical protein
MTKAANTWKARKNSALFFIGVWKDKWGQLSAQWDRARCIVAPY